MITSKPYSLAGASGLYACCAVAKITVCACLHVRMNTISRMQTCWLAGEQAHLHASRAWIACLKLLWKQFTQWMQIFCMKNHITTLQAGLKLCLPVHDDMLLDFKFCMLFWSTVAGESICDIVKSDSASWPCLCTKLHDNHTLYARYPQ